MRSVNPQSCWRSCLHLSGFFSSSFPWVCFLHVLEIFLTWKRSVLSGLLHNAFKRETMNRVEYWRSTETWPHNAFRSSHVP
ncbi:hypothetical protein MANES_01G137900v8 [Manihot esculenta]|uniref:Uncharacterized protein n=1 Tax=Manihot esculenta TaxID=3983 RepID=A0A2C9WKG9_MANES|nr:hypothetical protein MANES_01G137900v8 [Manihot esculenta]